MAPPEPVSSPMYNNSDEVIARIRATGSPVDVRLAETMIGMRGLHDDDTDDGEKDSDDDEFEPECSQKKQRGELPVRTPPVRDPATRLAEISKYGGSGEVRAHVLDRNHIAVDFNGKLDCAIKSVMIMNDDILVVHQERTTYRGGVKSRRVKFQLKKSVYTEPTFTVDKYEVNPHMGCRMFHYEVIVTLDPAA
jgi:hypothetical protein